MVLEVLWNPRGDYGFNRCLERTRTTTTPPTKTNTLHYGTNQKNSLFCCVCFSSRLSYHFCLLYIFFCVGKEWREFFELYAFLLSALVKGEHVGHSQFWWEEEILTLVADQGLNFFPFLFDCLYFNGNVGAGSDFLSSFEIFWKKWMIPNKLDPLCRPSMGRRRPSWTTNKGLPFGHDPRIFRWNANPPYWYYTWTPPRVKFVCIMRGGTRWWPDVMCS